MIAKDLRVSVSGATEGAVNRIKKIKRQLYGRSFELLRKMILLQ
ncbi:hypothetical protein [Streptomyces sp. NPDC093568]